MTPKGRGGGTTPPQVVELLQKAVSEKGLRAVQRDVGLGLAPLSRYLKGESEPTLASLEKMAAYFQTSVTRLRGEDVPEIKVNDAEGREAFLDAVRQQCGEIYAHNVRKVLELSEEQNHQLAKLIADKFT
ncbi:helix-turn-helix domain-containing protein [Geomonas nitrogeniifigens]|uniref:Helix-turn-helix domain-containing protein n=1 Tax=Geomonas diazotrophica TaxID=2843197 RepID=A0ABX8JGH7_9BACT|nr:helix-turn-helix transcriptional regulator [Geomonas nitrogeniifigens]QWV97475.1 helix-turn-helix domain-containing protein [Geomonas nitrogeniifigens]